MSGYGGGDTPGGVGAFGVFEQVADSGSVVSAPGATHECLVYDYDIACCCDAGLVFPPVRQRQSSDGSHNTGATLPATSLVEQASLSCR